jgi:hypothetical protein
LNEYEKQTMEIFTTNIDKQRTKNHHMMIYVGGAIRM